MFQKILLSLMGTTTIASGTLATVDINNGVSAGAYDLLITEAIYQSGQKNEYWTTEKADSFNIIEETYNLVQNFNYSITFTNENMATDFIFNSQFVAKDILTSKGKPLDYSMFKSGNTLNLMFNFSYCYDSSSKINITLI